MHRTVHVNIKDPIALISQRKRVRRMRLVFGRRVQHQLAHAALRLISFFFWCVCNGIVFIAWPIHALTLFPIGSSCPQNNTRGRLQPGESKSIFVVVLLFRCAIAPGLVHPRNCLFCQYSFLYLLPVQNLSSCLLLSGA
jgi:hypothetical protein